MSVVIDRYRGRLEVYIHNKPLIDGHTGKIASFKEHPAYGVDTELSQVLIFLAATTETDASSQSP